MTAEEFLVECYKQLKKDFDGAMKIIDDLREELEDKNEEISQYKNLVSVLQKHLTINKYGVEISLRNYKSEDADDLEYINDYFDTEFVENDECSE